MTYDDRMHKEKGMGLTPENYIGLSSNLVDLL